MCTWLEAFPSQRAATVPRSWPRARSGNIGYSTWLARCHGTSVLASRWQSCVSGPIAVVLRSQRRWSSLVDTWQSCVSGPIAVVLRSQRRCASVMDTWLSAATAALLRSQWRCERLVHVCCGASAVAQVRYRLHDLICLPVPPSPLWVRVWV